LYIYKEETSQSTPSETPPPAIPERRFTFGFSEHKSTVDQEKRAHKRQRTQEELDSLEEKVEQEKKKEEPISVLSAENIADRHNKREEKQDIFKMNLKVPVMDEAVKSNIKASFSIGQHKDTHPAILADLPKSLAMPKIPLKRKRKMISTNTSSVIPPKQELMISNNTSSVIPPKQELMISNNTSSAIPPKQELMEIIDSQDELVILDKALRVQPTPSESTTLISLTNELSLSTLEAIPSPGSSASSQLLSNSMDIDSIPKNNINIDTDPTIVFTCLSPRMRKRCTDVVNRLGKYKVVSE
jgi:hypothetical protein